MRSLATKNLRSRSNQLRYPHTITTRPPGRCVAIPFTPSPTLKYETSTSRAMPSGFTGFSCAAHRL